MDTIFTFIIYGQNCAMFVSSKEQNKQNEACFGPFLKNGSLVNLPIDRSSPRVIIWKAISMAKEGSFFLYFVLSNVSPSNLSMTRFRQWGATTEPTLAIPSYPSTIFGEECAYLIGLNDSISFRLQKVCLLISCTRK